MTLFPNLAPDSPRLAMTLNKRFIRIAVAAASFVIFVFVLLGRRGDGAAMLPALGWHEPSDFYPYTTVSSFAPISVDPVGKSTKELCESFPRHILNLVQPVLKMGHGENRSKIEAQLNSVSACFAPSELLIFSDLDEKVGDHQIIDILADLPDSYYNVAENPHIKNYLWQKEMRNNGTLDKDMEATRRVDGWIIDKYKFLPMLERAWLEKPNKPFYFFFETDTYVFWDNAFRFLQTFDPDQPIYMGSPSPGRFDSKRNIKTWFANGGPGYVLSRAAIKALLHRETSPHGQYIDPPLTEKWLPLLRGECCGDSVVGWTLWNASIALQGYWPMFNPHPLHGIPYSDRYWCQPVLTLHKTSPKDMVDVWRWEFGQRQHSRPLLYSDLFNFHHPGKPQTIDNWDNGDWDSWVPSADAGIDSSEKCEKLCQKEDKCVQWNWRGRDEKKCILMRAIRYGEAREPGPILSEEQKKKMKKGAALPKDARWADYKSGWVEDRINKWRKERQCKKVEWVGPSITRIF